jgi:hypothetical protein
MVAQLQAQNPLEPGNSNEYINELAQLTQVEQTTNLANANELSSAVGLIGHKVSYNNPSGVGATGIVQSVQSERVRHDRDRRRRPRRNAVGDHGSRMSQIANPALVPPGSARSAPGRRPRAPRRARAPRHGDAARKAAGAPQGPSFADTLAQAAGGSSCSSPSTRSRASQRRGIELDPSTLGKAFTGGAARREQGLARLPRTCRRHRLRGVRQQPHGHHGRGIRAHEGQRVHQHRQRRDRMRRAANDYGRTSSRRPRKEGQSG